VIVLLGKDKEKAVEQRKRPHEVGFLGTKRVYRKTPDEPEGCVERLEKTAKDRRAKAAKHISQGRNELLEAVVLLEASEHTADYAQRCRGKRETNFGRKFKIELDKDDERARKRREKLEKLQREAKEDAAFDAPSRSEMVDDEAIEDNGEVTDLDENDGVEGSEGKGEGGGDGHSDEEEKGDGEEKGEGEGEWKADGEGDDRSGEEPADAPIDARPDEILEEAMDGGEGGNVDGEGRPRKRLHRIVEGDPMEGKGESGGAVASQGGGIGLLLRRGLAQAKRIVNL